MVCDVLFLSWTHVSAWSLILCDPFAPSLLLYYLFVFMIHGVINVCMYVCIQAVTRTKNHDSPKSRHVLHRVLCILIIKSEDDSLQCSAITGNAANRQRIWMGTLKPHSNGALCIQQYGDWYTGWWQKYSGLVFCKCRGNSGVTASTSRRWKPHESSLWRWFHIAGQGHRELGLPFLGAMGFRSGVGLAGCR